MTNNTDTDEDYKCFICSTPIEHKNLPYNDIGWTKYNAFAALNICYCSNCGVGFAVPELSQENIYSYYKDQYRAKSSTYYIDFSTSVSNKISDIRDSRSFSQLMLARTFCKLESEDIFLDIGPGKGGSFQLAKALFFNPQLHSIELSENANEYYSRNFNVTNHSSLDEFSQQGNKAKIILMSHSLEHFRISDLDALFAGLQASMDKNSTLIVEVPRVDMRIHNDIRGPDTPHLLFFTEQSLKLLLEKYGFDVLYIDTCGPFYEDAPSNMTIETDSPSNGVKKHLRKTFNKLPIHVREIIRTIVRTSRKWKNYFSNKILGDTVTTLPYHSYGGDRMALRLVAKKSATNVTPSSP